MKSDRIYNFYRVLKTVNNSMTSILRCNITVKNNKSNYINSIYIY